MELSTHAKSLRITRLLALVLVVTLLTGVTALRLVDDNGSAAAAAAIGQTNTSAADDTWPSNRSATVVREGNVAPSFTLPGLDGPMISLSEWRGRPVLINFWATWCAPCELEIPVIQAAYEKHQQDGLVVLAVAVDDTAGDVRRFFDQHGLTFTVLLDEGTVAQAYQVFGLPTSFFVRSNGEIAAVHTGLLTEAKIETYLAQTQNSD